MFSPSLFNYCIVHRSGSSEEASPFQLFTRRWLELYSTFVGVLQGPTSLVDVYGSLTDRIQTRSTGLARYNILLVDPDLLLDIQPVPQMILVTTPSTDEAGRAFVRSHSAPTLHLPTEPSAEESGLFTISPEDFRRWFERQVAYWSPQHPDLTSAIGDVRRTLVATAVAQSHTLLVAAAPLTLGNDLAALSVGYNNYERVSVPEYLDGVSEQVLQRAYSQTRSLRSQHFIASSYTPGATELILTTPGMARELPMTLTGGLREDETDASVRAYRGLRILDSFTVPRDLQSAAISDARAALVANRREIEIEGQLAAVAVDACSQFAPVVPLGAGIRRTEPATAKLVELLRSRPKRWRVKVTETAKTVGDLICRTHPPFLKTVLEEVSGTVKVFSDHPLELTRVGDSPLSLRTSVVRVPVTPGYLLERLTTIGGPLFLQPTDFSEVLVVRGTAPTDPVYSLVENFCDRILSGSDAVKLVVRDVATLDELESVTNSFRGAMMIVDAHGIHPVRTSGKLLIGQEEVSSIALANRLRKVPPIVFLATCETHRPDMPSMTVALAFLMAGARTVVGTMAPVGALESALLATEILKVVRLSPSFPGPIRWSEVFGLAVLTTHVFEAVTALRHEGYISLSPLGVNEVVTTASVAILSFRRDWKEVTLQHLASATGQSVAYLKKGWDRYAYITDSVLHCQLGQADTVWISPSQTWGH